MIESIRKWLTFGLLVIAVISAIYGGYKWIEKEGSSKADLEGRLYKDEAQRILEEQHLKDFKESLKVRINFEAHVDELSHEMITLANELKAQRKVDSILRRKDIITNYQSKKNIDTLIKYWKKYNSEQEKIVK